MHPQDFRIERLRRRRQPAVERLEARDLPSTLPNTSTSAGPRHRVQAAAVQALAHRAVAQPESQSAGNHAHTDSPNGLIGKRPPAPFLNPNVIDQFANLLYGPSSPTPMTPSARELKRQTFTGSWVGEYTIGPPRFSDRASTIHAWSKTGGSNQFLKGKLDMVLFPPADPSADAPHSRQSVRQSVNRGCRAVQPKPSPVEWRPCTRCERLRQPDLGPSWPARTSPPGPSRLEHGAAGPYAAPQLFQQGGGTINLKWIPDAHPLPGSMGSGKVIVAFQGLINSSQIVSPISKFIS